MLKKYENRQPKVIAVRLTSKNWGGVERWCKGWTRKYSGKRVFIRLPGTKDAREGDYISMDENGKYKVWEKQSFEMNFKELFK